PADDVAFRRAIQTPGRGIGRATLTRLEELAVREARPLLALAAAPPADVTGKPRRALEEFAALITRLVTAREKTPLPAFIDLVLDASGYREDLKQERSSEADARLENLEELIAAAEDHARGQEDATLEGFLDGVALASDVDALPDGARSARRRRARGRAAGARGGDAVRRCGRRRPAPQGRRARPPRPLGRGARGRRRAERW